jgi:hypothetical protein
VSTPPSRAAQQRAEGIRAFTTALEESQLSDVATLCQFGLAINERTLAKA